MPEESHSSRPGSGSRNRSSPSRRRSSIDQALPSHSSSKSGASTAAKKSAAKGISSKYFPVNQDFFLITGPGGSEYDKETAQALSNAISSGPGQHVVRRVGDGASSITVDGIRTEFEQFISAVKEDHPTAKGCCIILQVQGQATRRGLDVKLGSGCWCLIYELFQIFKAAESPYHLSVLILSSKSNNAIIYGHHNNLPKGSTIITTTDHCFSWSGITPWINALGGKWKDGASILDLLNLFLFHGLPGSERIYPRLSIVRRRDYNLSEVYEDSLQETIKPKVIGMIRERHEIEGNKLVTIADNIKNARHRWSLDLVDYGTALTLMLSQRLIIDLRSRSKK
ncbi:hypothetical protein CJF32_00000304 [Rutstroemia sp. NJR-2017a WRK4]|nr:hypothetical protein CJF32_00000304 [Rutstroemia sp. NJR-2017a WRK4]